MFRAIIIFAVIYEALLIALLLGSGGTNTAHFMDYIGHPVTMLPQPLVTVTPLGTPTPGRRWNG